MSVQQTLMREFKRLRMQIEGATPQTLRYTPSLLRLLGHGDADAAYMALAALEFELGDDRNVGAALAAVNIGVRQANVADRLNTFAIDRGFDTESEHQLRNMYRWVDRGVDLLVAHITESFGSDEAPLFSVDATITHDSEYGARCLLTLTYEGFPAPPRPDLIVLVRDGSLALEAPNSDDRGAFRHAVAFACNEGFDLELRLDHIGRVTVDVIVQGAALVSHDAYQDPFIFQLLASPTLKPWWDD